MTPKRASLLVFLLGMAILASLAALGWANGRIASLNPREDHFLTYWAGTRAFVFEGLSPYSPTAMERMQEIAYGHSPRPQEYTFRAAYPFYAILAFLPFGVISDYTLARAVWMTFLQVALFLLAFFSLRLTRWGPALWLLIIYFLFAFFWAHGLNPLLNGNALVLSALLVALALLAIRNERDELAGICLAFATFHPLPIILLLGFVLLWAISRRRGAIVVWFFGVFIALTVLGMFLITDWPLQFVQTLFRYPEPAPASWGAALGQALPGIGRQIGWALTALFGVVLVAEWFVALRKDFRWFLWTACLTLVINQMVGIPTGWGNFVLLFLPLTLVWAAWEERAGPRGRLFIVGNLFLLALGGWRIYLRVLDSTLWPVQPPILLFLLPLYLLIGLYWVRWWAVRPPRLFVDDLI